MSIELNQAQIVKDFYFKLLKNGHREANHTTARYQIILLAL